MVWFKDLDIDNHPEKTPALSKVVSAIKYFRPIINEFSQAESGDKTLRVDSEEVTLTRFNGNSTEDREYMRHKDSYYHDKNNEIHGTSLRKISMIMFLNDDLDEAYSLPDANKGMLRLYQEKGEGINEVVDISPRLGRVVLFKSEEMLHKVMSTHKWDNYILTAYFN